MESGSVSDDVYLDVFTGLGDDGGGQRGRARGGGAWGGWKRDVERCEAVVAGTAGHRQWTARMAAGCGAEAEEAREGDEGHVGVDGGVCAYGGAGESGSR